MKVVAAALILALCLAGCAGPGPLEDGRWFYSYPPDAGPFLWLARSMANVGLATVYVAASLVRFFPPGYSSSRGW